MDDPALPFEEHRHALAGLARINRWSRVAESVWPLILRTQQEVKREVRVLDVACGGADVTCRLQRIADRKGVPCRVDGCDLSARAVEWANHGVEDDARGSVRPQFFVHDAVRDPLPDGYDVVFTTLFLHHLTTADAARVLRHMASAARVGVAAVDLRRGVWPWLFTWAGTRLVTRSRVVHTDGPRSAAAGWRRAELHRAARDAGLDGATVEAVFPLRWRLWWRREP